MKTTSPDFLDYVSRFSSLFYVLMVPSARLSNSLSTKKYDFEKSNRNSKWCLFLYRSHSLDLSAYESPIVNEKDFSLC